MLPACCYLLGELRPNGIALRRPVSLESKSDEQSRAILGRDYG